MIELLIGENIEVFPGSELTKDCKGCKDVLCDV